MITRNIYIPSCRWEVHIYYAVKSYHAPPILADLTKINCPEQILKQVSKNLHSGKMDSGFTYSNKRWRCTVMVIGIHSSPAEFLNSLQHELRHFVDDVSDACNIPVRGEAVAYLTGDINSYIAEDVKMFLCDCHGCKEKLEKRRLKPDKIRPETVTEVSRKDRGG